MKKVLFVFCSIIIIAIAFVPLACNKSGAAPYEDGNGYIYYDYDRDGQYDYYFYYINDELVDWDDYWYDKGDHPSPFDPNNDQNHGNDTGTGSPTGGSPTGGSPTGGSPTGGSPTGTNGPVTANGSVTAYPFPSGYPKFSGITMTAGGKNIDLYSVKVNNTHRWTEPPNQENTRTATPVGMFDMTGSVEVTVTVSAGIGDASKVTIRPVSENYGKTVNGNKVTFVIPKTGHYSLEYSSNPKDAVLIFANPVESAPGGAQVYEGGRVHDIGIKNVSGTVYLAPGAVVRGGFVLNSGAKLVGRGIIDGSNIAGWTTNGYRATLPIEAVGASNIEVKGISIFDPNAWCVQLQDSSNVTLDNVKIISSRCNSDGVSIQSSNNITVKNSFIRTWDDGVVVKNYTKQDSNKITVQNTVFWTDLAQSMEIGVETNKGEKGNPRIYDCTFQDIVVFHALHKAPISIHNGDNAVITNINWKNITVENFSPGEWPFLIDITNLTGQAMGGAASWTTVQARGTISGVTIDNVKVIGGNKNSNGRFDSSGGGSISVTLKNIYFKGNKLTSLGTPKSATVNWQ